MPTTLDTIATILFTYAGHSAAACLVALGLARLLRRPQDRDVIWKAAIIAPLLTTAVAAARLATGAQFDVSEWVRRAASYRLPGREVMVRITRDASGERIVHRVNDPVTLTIASIVVVVAAICIGIASVRMLSRYRRRGVLLADRRSLTTSADVRISIAVNLPSPVALGRREICLPLEVAAEFSADHRGALVAHELAHLERRDPAWFGAVEIIAAFSAFQPLIWPVVRAFRRDVELICDEAAVRRTSNPHALIGALAKLASPFDARSPMHGAALAHDGSPLVARAERIAALVRVDDARRVGARATLVAAALIAGLFAVPTIASSPRDPELPLFNHPDAVREAKSGGPVFELQEEQVLRRAPRDIRMTKAMRVIRL
jgi:beta-lactamase regulating signal transducer with metallopeptidase domain